MTTKTKIRMPVEIVYETAKAKLVQADGRRGETENERHIIGALQAAIDKAEGTD